jgi:arsenate reductase
MRQVDIDIGGARTQDVFELFKAGRRFHYVISVCDDASAERCPIFPGMMERLNWSFSDPSTFVGSQAERLVQTAQVRDQIRARIEAWIREVADNPGRRRRLEE